MYHGFSGTVRRRAPAGGKGGGGQAVQEEHFDVCVYIDVTEEEEIRIYMYIWIYAYSIEKYVFPRSAVYQVISCFSLTATTTYRHT